MKVKCILDIKWDAEHISLFELKEFLEDCGEDTNTDVEVIEIVEFEEKL